MSYKPLPRRTEWPDSVVKKCPELAACYYATRANTDEVVEDRQRRMLETQKDYRQQLKTKGIVTYEEEVDEDYEEDEDEYYAPLHPPGRRRHRPGVMKNRHGETRRLN
ncbi:hypothetical protein ACQJBY_000376 [Aegilops geniculata]